MEWPSIASQYIHKRLEIILPTEHDLFNLIYRINAFSVYSWQYLWRGETYIKYYLRAQFASWAWVFSSGGRKLKGKSSGGMVDLGSIYILSSFSTPTERASGFPEAIVLSVTIFPSLGSQPTNHRHHHHLTLLNMVKKGQNVLVCYITRPHV